VDATGEDALDAPTLTTIGGGALDAPEIGVAPEAGPRVDPAAGSGYASLPAEARAAVDAAMALLLAEVRSTLIEAEDRLGVGIDDLRLSGGSARMRELAARLAEDLGVPVRPAADPDGEVVPLGFHLSHALAMRAADQSRRPALDLPTGALQLRRC